MGLNYSIIQTWEEMLKQCILYVSESCYYNWRAIFLMDISPKEYFILNWYKYRIISSCPA